MMAQYLAIKRDVGETVMLFYRMGDFYELFFDDAVKAAAALDIALTKRGRHEGEDIPMCGVPVHAAENYLQKLIKSGFRVAVCEQTENPEDTKRRDHKAVVRREVVRVVTPGTLTEDKLLNADQSNHILSVYRTLGGDIALAWADISEGNLQVMGFGGQDSAIRLASELAALRPREIVFPDSLYTRKDIIFALENSAAALSPVPKSKFDSRVGERRIKEIFSVCSLEGLGDFSTADTATMGGLLDYIEMTQAGGDIRLSPPKKLGSRGFMAIDAATRKGLEIERTQQGARKGSLLSVIDRTVSGPGARLLASRLSQPLIDVDMINARLDAVSYFTGYQTLKDDIRSVLKSVGDPARSIGRLSLGRGGPRDMLVIAQALKCGESIGAMFSHDTKIPGNISTALSALDLMEQPELAGLARDIAAALADSVPMLARDGNFIREGWNNELDQVRKLRDDSRRVVAGLQAQYADRVKIPSLKIKHNNVLGYFVEVTPKYADQILSGADESIFIHRQTLVSGIRFTTTELADLDTRISGAGDRALAIEIAIFDEFVRRITDLAEPLRQQARALAALDVQTGLAQWAVDSGATRPAIDDSSIFKIEGGRHPVVVDLLRREGREAFTPNDCHLDASGVTAPRLTLITGPNMAGKSTYLRQNALIFILAQSGSFVLASKAHIGVADSLFSRVGASDDLSRGRSTFMTEMIETAAILNRASEKSFVILDEIGRGTATFDGLSIAWATAEHLHSVNGSRAMFATHYHELTDLAEDLRHGSNACLRAREWDGDLIFLHDVVPGAADKSYGVQVAKLAGLPDAAVQRAREVLKRLEGSHDSQNNALGGLPLFSAVPVRIEKKPSEVEGIIASIDINDITPRQALDLLFDLRSKTDRTE